MPFCWGGGGYFGAGRCEETALDLDLRGFGLAFVDQPPGPVAFQFFELVEIDRRVIGRAGLANLFRAQQWPADPSQHRDGQRGNDNP